MTTSNVVEGLDERSRILAHLAGFIRQRSGIDARNYISSGFDREGLAAYRREQREITRDLHDARALLNAVTWRQSITAEDLKKAFRAFSGRLQWHAQGSECEICHGTGKTGAQRCYSCKGTGVYAKDLLDYCTGQYFPTEYRKAVCAVLASALWDYWRADAKPTGKRDEGGCEVELYGPRREYFGDYIKRLARNEFGRSIANRWFN